MKKLKKFKIIEEGRRCSPEEMKEIVGGYWMCAGGDSLTVCPTDWFMSSCQPSAAGGFFDDSCGQGFPQTLQICTEGYKYDTCLGIHYTCGGENTYVG